MQQSRKILIRALRFLGFLAFLLGLATVGYSWFGLKPKVEKIQNEALGDIRAVQSSLLAPGSSGVRDLIAITDFMPETLIVVRGALLETSNALYSGATTTQKVKNSLAGLVLPQNAMGIDTQYLQKTADQLRLLRGVLGELTPKVNRLSNDLKILPMARLNTRIDSFVKIFNQIDLDVHAALLGSALGGIFIFFSFYFFALGALVAVQAEQQTNAVVREFPRAA